MIIIRVNLNKNNAKTKQSKSEQLLTQILFQENIKSKSHQNFGTLFVSGKT